MLFDLTQPTKNSVSDDHAFAIKINNLIHNLKVAKTIIVSNFDTQVSHGEMPPVSSNTYTAGTSNNEQPLVEFYSYEFNEYKTQFIDYDAYPYEFDEYDDWGSYAHINYERYDGNKPADEIQAP